MSQKLLNLPYPNTRLKQMRCKAVPQSMGGNPFPNTSLSGCSLHYFLHIIRSQGLALFALKTGTPVVPAFLTRKDDGRYECIYEEPIYLEKGSDLQQTIQESTQVFSDIIEAHIRRTPDQWFWLHRRSDRT